MSRIGIIGGGAPGIAAAITAARNDRKAQVFILEQKEKIGRKILDAELEKVPYKLVVGDKEVEEGTVSVRRRGEGDIGAMPKADFFALVKEENDSKKVF